MKKYIYKITNKINQKKYIGQTNNIERRFREHRNLGGIEEKEKILYRAIQQYGIDNFDFSIIEGPIENYNEREKFWIKEYNTYIKSENAWGYNMTEGGEEPLHPSGEEHPLAVHTWDDINKIIDLLKNTDISIKEIAQQFNYNTSSIERINKGQLWNIDGIKYPIRLEATFDFNRQRAEKIKQDLLYTNLTQKEIGLKYNVARSTVTAINRGQNYYDDSLDYPLRKQNQQSKPILMIDIETKQIIKEFKDSVEAMKYLKVNGNPDAIRQCARKGYGSSFGYFWQYKER